MLIIGYIFALLLGLVIGSFLNVCIWRMPREESIVLPPSHCPKCGQRLSWWENIPLFSFLLLKGRCRKCKVKISWRYFLVELLTGVAFVAVWWAWFLDPKYVWNLPAYLIFTACLIAIFFIDLEHMIIPDELVIAAAAAAVIKAGGEFFGLGGGLADALLRIPIPGTEISFPFPTFLAGAILGVAVFVGIELFSRLLFRKEGMGGGDMKLAGAIGALLGPATALLSFGLAVLAGAALGVVLIISRLRKRVDYIPFGPFMVVTAFALMVAPVPIRNAATSAWSWWMSTWVPK
jgi:leader peptidase (prepilin peptidase)/N-methyltransferase